MNLLEQMDKHAIKETLNKCWITHDGMWFAHTLAAHGIEETNRLNRAAIKSMVPIEIRRFMNALDLEKKDIRDFTGFTVFFSAVREFLIPDFMNVRIRFEAPDKILWQFNHRGCFAYNGVKQANVQTQYLCGPLYRIQCWLEYLEIAYEMNPRIGVCIMEEKGRCSGWFQLIFPASC